MRFLDVKTDYAFKRVFGAEGSKPILISFLNAILEYEGEQANGKQVIIEMQLLSALASCVALPPPSMEASALASCVALPPAQPDQSRFHAVR